MPLYNVEVGCVWEDHTWSTQTFNSIPAKDETDAYIQAEQMLLNDHSLPLISTFEYFVEEEEPKEDPTYVWVVIANVNGAIAQDQTFAVYANREEAERAKEQTIKHNSFHLEPGAVTVKQCELLP